MPRSVVWLAGRGVSLNCGLEWDVPAELYEAFKRGELPREALARRISEELARAQESAPIDTWPLDSLLLALRKHGNQREWKHLFVTTNWDTVLDEVLQSHPAHEGVEASVAHLNGSIDDPSTLFTEADSREARDAAININAGFQNLLKAQVCVVVGISLSNALDQELVARLGSRQDVPAASGAWLVVNHAPEEVQRVCDVLREHLPRARLIPVTTPFDAWVRGGMPELRELGVIYREVVNMPGKPQQQQQQHQGPGGQHSRKQRGPRHDRKAARKTPRRHDGR